MLPAQKRSTQWSLVEENRKKHQKGKRKRVSKKPSGVKDEEKVQWPTEEARFWRPGENQGPVDTLSIGGPLRFFAF